MECWSAVARCVQILKMHEHCEFIASKRWKNTIPVASFPPPIQNSHQTQGPLAPLSFIHTHNTSPGSSTVSHIVTDTQNWRNTHTEKIIISFYDCKKPQQMHCQVVMRGQAAPGAVIPKKCGKKPTQLHLEARDQALPVLILTHTAFLCCGVQYASY